MSKPDPQANSAASVSFWSVHAHVQSLLEHAGAWPMVGTPEWCALADDDERKLAALLDAARHHALRLELNQEARAEASHDVAASEDWRAIANEISQRNRLRAEWPWMNRQAG